MSVENASKPTMPLDHVAARVAQFSGRVPGGAGDGVRALSEVHSLDSTRVSGRRYSIVASRRALFVDKADLFPGCWFVVGADTAERILDPQFYGGHTGKVLALDAMRRRGCRFLVAPRATEAAGHLQTLADLAHLVPVPFQEDVDAAETLVDCAHAPFLRAQKRNLPTGPLFQTLEGFRCDVSSTQLRQQAWDGAEDTPSPEK
jgi:hypothetical protein